MRLGLSLGHSEIRNPESIRLAQLAETLGFDSIWTAESYGMDAVVPLTWIAANTRRIGLGTAIMQMAARTPASTAMTAASLDQLSNGRFRLGLGLSGPQVVEGWHGVPFREPIPWAREYVALVREILRREDHVEFQGSVYRIPFTGPGATGLGKPLKLAIKKNRPNIPIYLGAIGPKNVALAVEIADGWLPVFFNPLRYREVYGSALAGVDVGFDIAPTVEVVLGREIDSCMRKVKRTLALYIGGMGATKRNFYKNLMALYGFGEVAQAIQDLYLAGKKEQAVEMVPDRLVDEVALCGPTGRITDLLDHWRSTDIQTLIVSTSDPKALELMAELTQ